MFSMEKKIKIGKIWQNSKKCLSGDPNLNQLTKSGPNPPLHEFSSISISQNYKFHSKE